MPEKKVRPKMEFPTNVPQEFVLGEKFYEKEHAEYGWSFGWNVIQDGAEKVMFIKPALNDKLKPFQKGTKVKVIYAEKKNDSGKPYHEWEVFAGNGSKPELRTEPDTRDVDLEQRQVDGFAAHLLGCADTAILVAEKLGLKEDQARQACFATVCIDAQRHGIILRGENGEPKAKPKYDIEPKNEGAIANATAEQAEAAKRESLQQGIQGACTLLNKEGIRPPMTPQSLNQFIGGLKVESGSTLESLDAEDMETLLKELSDKLDKLRAEKLADDDIPF